MTIFARLSTDEMREKGMPTAAQTSAILRLPSFIMA